MADDAFALSPMAARSTQPTEADYDAIRDAFMETARGRWFLGEYAKRNRNADTTTVLEAVARLEHSFAKQKQQSSGNRKQIVAAVLAEVLSVFTSLRGELETAANADFFENVTKPLRDSARIIQEIGWGLRESGSDSRICNLLDGQGAAINALCDHLSLADLHGKIVQLFDEAGVRLNEIGGPGAAAEAADTPPHPPAAGPSPTPIDIAPRGSVEPAPELRAETIELKPLEPEIVELKLAQPGIVEPETAERGIVEFQTASSEPMIAADENPETPPAIPVVDTEAPVQPPPQALVTPRGPVIRFQEPEEKAPIEEPEDIVQQAAIVEPEPESKFEAAIAGTAVAPGSLGASILANGLVTVSPARPDPMAAFKPMSQAEKIALFS